MKKIISVLLSLALCLGMCPPVARAAEENLVGHLNFDKLLGSVSAPMGRDIPGMRRCRP